ncbi:MAG: PorV/PorQ family protein [Ignavibacteriaceae bacterium]|nr:PorV/PorQ family protein [Ignavibacteriaceae bacterium]
MTYFLRISLVCLMLLPLSRNVFAQGEAAVPFLLLAPDSRFSALGESGTGLADNSSAIFWNPAGIAFLTGQEFTFTHSNWLPQFKLDLFYDYATYRNYIEDIDGSVTASITYMNYGEFVRTGEGGPEPLGTFRSFDAAVTLGYATKISSDWGLGFNFRLIHSNLSDQPTAEEQGTGVATTVSFDVGCMWRPERLSIPFTDLDIGGQLSIGLNVSNLGPKIFYIDKDQADPIPTNFRLGFAYRIYSDEYNSLTYTLDFSKLLVKKDTTGKSDEFYQALFTSWLDKPFKTELRDIVTSTGLEYWYGQPGDFLFALRGGFFYEDPSYGNRKFMTLGAGIRYDIYGFDFSYISTAVFKNGENHPLSNTLRFTFVVGWDAIIESSKGLPRGL